MVFCLEDPSLRDDLNSNDGGTIGIAYWFHYCTSASNAVQMDVAKFMILIDSYVPQKKKKKIAGSLKYIMSENGWNWKYEVYRWRKLSLRILHYKHGKGKLIKDRCLLYVMPFSFSDFKFYSLSTVLLLQMMVCPISFHVLKFLTSIDHSPCVCQLSHGPYHFTTILLRHVCIMFNATSHPLTLWFSMKLSSALSCNCQRALAFKGNYSLKSLS